MSEENLARKALVESETQGDEDGVMCFVSRQALHEFVGEFDAAMSDRKHLYVRLKEHLDEIDTLRSALRKAEEGLAREKDLRAKVDMVAGDYCRRALKAEEERDVCAQGAYQRGLEDGAKRMENGRTKAESELAEARKRLGEAKEVMAGLQHMGSMPWPVMQDRLRAVDQFLAQQEAPK